MSALPRPALTGAPRVLNDALHDLHHRAGWPQPAHLGPRNRRLPHHRFQGLLPPGAASFGGRSSCSLRRWEATWPSLPDLWLAASSLTNDEETLPAAPLAGRRAELTALRRHFETGCGAFLVTGEAGIGKTTLVTTAAATADALVGVGRCLPLSTEVPLLPVADALRTLLEHEVVPCSSTHCSGALRTWRHRWRASSLR